MKKIKLTKGKYALVDNEDFEHLKQWSWHLSTKGYAVRGTHRVIEGKRTAVRFYMHRELAKTPKGLQTDHINRNKLDNRKCNLRNVNNQQNHFNLPVNSKNTTGYTGVYWYKKGQLWHAQLTFNGRKLHLGYFFDKRDAILARLTAEQKYHAI